MTTKRITSLAFAANILVWGYNWVPLHLLVQRTPPAMLVAGRVLLGAFTLLAALTIMRRPITFPRSKIFVVVGLLQVSGMMGFSTFALLFGDVSRTTILVFMMPFWATLFSRVVLKERISVRRWIAIGVAVAGLAFIALHTTGGAAAFYSAAFAVAAGMCWAGGAVLAKRHLQGDDLLSGVFWQQLVGAVPLLLFALVRHEHLNAPSAGTIGLFLFASVFGTGLGWLLWATVLSKVSASTASLGSLGIPLVAAIAAFIQLGERPDMITGLGLGAILLAIVISSTGGGQARSRRRVAAI